MADNTFPFEILTPERRFFSGEIEALTFTLDLQRARPQNHDHRSMIF